MASDTITQSFLELSRKEASRPRDYFDLLVSPQGVPGAQGPAGVPGATGPAGATGAQGPSGSSGSGGSTYSAQNKDSVNLKKGAPVTEDVSGSGFVRADPTANGKYCVGLLAEDINQTISGLVQTAGPLTLSDWTLIAGTATLSAKAKYYLDVTAGKISTAAPNTPGQINQRIGFAVDSLTLSINIGYPILL